MTTQELPDLITLQQAAEYFGTHINTVGIWCTSGELPSFKVGNTRRIRKTTLLAWIEARERS